MKRRHTGRHVARLLLVGAMSAGLAACGGGGGDDDPIDGGFDAFDPNDVDGDGILNADDPDYDPSDLDGDGILNLDDDDVDGDGILNEDDEDFVENDADGDGFSDVGDGDACGGESGTDAVSVNFTWDDNCLVRREGQAPGEGQFADSLYSVGVQRVLYCAGFGETTRDRDENGTIDVNDFADGEFGPGSETALVDYQRDRELTFVDGEVGPETWGELQGELQRIDTITDDGASFDRYTVPGDRCGDEVLFYNALTFVDGGTSVMMDGWELASSAGSERRIPFSTAQPFGVID